jgi:cytochrome c5
MKRTIIFISTLLFIAACSKQAVVAPSQADADRASAKFPGITLAEINEGKSLYEANCGKCHGLKKPASRNEEKWRQIVPRMAKKAKIDAETEAKILKYVVTMSEAQNSAK